MRIIFVRHGDPDYARDCLTDKGRRQAELAAERLEGEGIGQIWSSPQGRAMQTAQAASARLGIAPVRVLDCMHEICWGSADGTPAVAGGNPWNIADQLVREGWDLTRADWREHPYFRANLAAPEADKVARGIDAWLEGLGCRREGLYYRCLSPESAEATVALFGHGGSSAAAMAHILNLPFPYLCGTLRLPFTGITVLRIGRKPGQPAMPVVELASDGRHLGGEA